MRLHRSQCKSAFHDAAGFTLLELMVVIVFIAILVSFIVPSININSGRQLSDAAERMVLLINLAQQEAVLSSRIWQVVFDGDEDSYTFQQYSGVEFDDVTMRPLSGKHRVEDVSLNELELNGQIMSSNSGEVYLFPTGEQDPFRLVLKSGPHKYMVAMNPVGPAWMEEL